MERRLSIRPGLLSYMADNFSSLFTGIDPPACPPGFQSISQSQQSIGWDNLLRGFASTEWIHAQRDFQHTIPGNYGHNPDSWLSTVLESITDLQYDAWIDHTQTIYGHNNAEANLFERQSLERDVRTLHLQRPRVLADDRDKLFLPDITAYLNSHNNSQIFNWISIHKPAIMESARTAQSESVSGSRQLNTYFPTTRPGTTTRSRFHPTLHNNRRTQGRRPSVRLRAQPLHLPRNPLTFVASITRFFTAPRSTSRPTV
jgi:hypothetical protein